MDALLRWLGFIAGVSIGIGTIIAVVKTLIVPRRSFSLIPVNIGRWGYRIFHGIAVRFRSFDLADRFLGFQAPTIIIFTLAAFLASFTLAFALMLLPWTELTMAEALRESGSSVFTLGFVSTAKPIPTTLDVLAGATGMIFVALTIGYLPPLYAEIRHREALVKQLEVWTGKPSWGPEILARFTLADGLDLLPRLFAAWDRWCARVAESHMKYPILVHFRGPRARNHFLLAMLAVADAAALQMALRPAMDHTDAKLLLRQVSSCVRDVAYSMRRVDTGRAHPELARTDFDEGMLRLEEVGYPSQRSWDDGWDTFATLRTHYASITCQLLYWTVAPPAPWSGDRTGFPDIADRPDAPMEWPFADASMGDQVEFRGAGRG